MLCLPLRRFFGWGMSIQPNKVSPKVRDKVIAYQQECDEVLWRHWNEKFQQSRSATAPPQGVALTNTPPRAPLVFPYTDAQGHVLEVRVAVRDGRPEVVVFDLGNALGEKEHEFLKWYAGIPARYHGAIPSRSGETVLATLGAEGLAYLFGQRAHRPEVDAFRTFWFGTVEPALAARRAGPVAKARPEVPPAAETEPAGEPPEASREDDGALRARFVELAIRLWRQRDGGKAANVTFPNCGAILARLWMLPEGEWLALGRPSGFARSLGMAHGKSAEQGLKRLLGWGLVEARPAEAAWPQEIRLDRAAILFALSEAGLERMA